MRGKIRSALWAMVRHWAENGCATSKVEHGSFREWGHVVGGIVESLGMESPLHEVSLLRGGDTDLSDMEALLQDIWTAGADGEDVVQDGAGALAIRPKDLMARARALGLFTRFLSDEEPAGSVAQKERAIFGKICYRFEGKILECGIRFSKSATSREHRKYLLERR